MLELPIKQCWFNEIICGNKKEEYRDDTPYYHARFERYLGSFKMVILRAGYSMKSPKALANVFIKKGHGRPEWGAVSGRTYYVLEIISINIINL